MCLLVVAVTEIALIIQHVKIGSALTLVLKGTHVQETQIAE